MHLASCLVLYKRHKPSHVEYSFVQQHRRKGVPMDHSQKYQHRRQHVARYLHTLLSDIGNFCLKINFKFNYLIFSFPFTISSYCQKLTKCLIFQIDSISLFVTCIHIARSVRIWKHRHTYVIISVATIWIHSFIQIIY